METISLLNFITAFLTISYLYTVVNFIKGWNSLEHFIPPKATPVTSVSIIIAARNEQNNIGTTLKVILAQQYPESLFEVIVINDHSTDGTEAVVNAYTSDRVRLINFTAPETINSYKKAAIAMGVKAAVGELIVTTDADCSMGTEWLRTIVAFYEAHNYKMISSPVVYHKERNLFDRLQALEFLYLIGIGASTIGNRQPATCNGANLAYQKKAFNAVGGFKGIDHLASGDDELLLHKLATADPSSIGFLKNRAAIVYTDAKPTLGAFIQQRKRWASKSTSYKNKGVIVLGLLFWLFNVILLVNAVSAVFMPALWLTVAIQFILKVLLEYIFLKKLTGFSNRTSLLSLLPILSILHVIYLLFIGIAGNIGTYKWKGRTVN